MLDFLGTEYWFVLGANVDWFASRFYQRLCRSNDCLRFVRRIGILAQPRFEGRGQEEGLRSRITKQEITFACKRLVHSILEYTQSPSMSKDINGDTFIHYL